MEWMEIELFLLATDPLLHVIILFLPPTSSLLLSSLPPTSHFLLPPSVNVYSLSNLPEFPLLSFTLPTRCIPSSHETHETQGPTGRDGRDGMGWDGICVHMHEYEYTVLQQPVDLDFDSFPAHERGCYVSNRSDGVLDSRFNCPSWQVWRVWQVWHMAYKVSQGLLMQARVFCIKVGGIRDWIRIGGTSTTYVLCR